MNNQLVDFHCHVLPELDDGSKSVTESLDLLRLSFNNGVKSIVATPHFYTETDSLENFLKERRESISLLKKQLTPSLPKIFIGAEVTYFSGISKSQSVKELCIEGTNVLLIEMPCSIWKESILHDVIELKEKLNVQPVIAHIERYGFIQSNKTLKFLHSNGILFQFSCDFFAKKANIFKKKLVLNNNYVNLLGTDFHNLTDRKPNLTLDIEKQLGKNLKKITDLSNELLLNATEIKNEL